MKLLAAVMGALAIASASATTCVDFSLGPGTGCAWMCNYCAGALGTNNYYFTTDVCTYEAGVGCVGSPQAGATYTCCAAGDEEEEIIAEDAEEGDESWEDSCEDAEEIVFESEDIYLVTVTVKATKLA